ncbi:hypothetical protein AVEN_88529-1 [Araneus ventricosus]|uniref:Uncharacterized protein n=1 Tax=Araneus ventricosus TaxID=182803 RepID=A0A4Y2UR23_ARAVE|nr:hypothetical protein AVEN_85627-1 [Araneus ventricosus]GBO14515.1 hypothetical protein AVEN_88529-1 [Araneus ventricosus]
MNDNRCNGSRTGAGVLVSISGHDLTPIAGAPLKPGPFGRKRHELDSPNLGGHLPPHLTPSYKLPLRHTEMGCGLQGLLDTLTAVRTSPPLKRSQLPQTGLFLS